jgi:predicted GTPase
MVRLTRWQWVVIAAPIAAIVGFLLIAAGWQIHTWHLNWIWGIVVLIFVGWRWLLVKWTQPTLNQIEAAIEGVSSELELIAEADVSESHDPNKTRQAEAALQTIIENSRRDLPIWEDWPTFWNRCQSLVVAIAQIYHPEVKYPLLNIYIPQAYGLIRGTVDDMDRWMQNLSPVLSQATVGQAYQAYEVYQKLEPSARKIWQVWNWAQWVLNPAAAVARQASQQSSNKATQQLLANLGQLLRETALHNLCRQAIALYSGTLPQLESPISTPQLPKAKTQTLQEIIERAEPVERIEQKPVNILLVGRTGAGKSSLINTLFQADRAEVDVLPSTDRIQNYHWQLPTGETLALWDTPGYEQVNREDLRERVLNYAIKADLVLLVTPALDPALQMDADFLTDLKISGVEVPTIAIVTQVDRLRPLREWQPPYDWQWGDRSKEQSIREATAYRAERLGETFDRILPVVTGDSHTGRAAWNADMLSVMLVESIDPAKQLRLARFLRDREARSVAAAKIIDSFTLQMSTTQGLTALLKSPVLQFISTLTTGSPTLAYLLAEQIPIEQLPVVIGKLQMAYDLFNLFNADGGTSAKKFDLLALWPLLLENPASPDRNAWAFGHALVEYWTQDLTIEQTRKRFRFYLDQQTGEKRPAITGHEKAG